MDIEKALSVVSRQAPCAHDNANTELGNGKIWAACEYCGATFQQERWDDARQASKDFDDAISVIRDEIARLRDENESLRGSLEEWKLDLNSLRDENARLRVGLTEICTFPRHRMPGEIARETLAAMQKGE